MRPCLSFLILVSSPFCTVCINFSEYATNESHGVHGHPALSLWNIPCTNIRSGQYQSHSVDLAAAVSAKKFDKVPVSMPRKYPNIILTGTPGVGKTTTAQQLVELTKSAKSQSIVEIPLWHLSINKVAKEQNFYDSYDAELETNVVDEDKLLDHVEELISDGEGEGGCVVDWHVCDIFPERWFDLVVVLRCEDTQVFYERLTSDKKAETGETRGYEGKKLQENIDAEIFGVIADEAKEAWPNEGQVVELQSVQAEQIEENAERIWAWCQQWVKDHADQANDG